MALPVTITGINTTVSCVGPFKLAAGNYDNPIINIVGGITGGNNLSGGSGNAYAQTFTNVASSTTINSFTLVMHSGGTPTGTFYVEVTATDQNGAVLATSTSLDLATLGLSGLIDRPVTFRFPSPATISASATFAVIVRRPVQDSSNYPSLANSTSAAYAGGALLVWNVSSWVGIGGDWICSVNTDLNVASDRYYFFGRNSTTATTLSAFKATAPDTSWASITTKTGFTTAILNLAACQVGKNIHILVQDGTASTALATKYVSYDMIAETFLATTETVSAAVAVTGQVTGAGAGASLVVRSSGEVVAFYTGVQTKTSGTFRMRVYYRRRTAVNTWSTETQVDNNTTRDNQYPLVALGDSDRVHFFFHDVANLNQRHLTNANVLGTSGFPASGSAAAPRDIITLNDSGTIRFALFQDNFVVYFSSADNPTLSTGGFTGGGATSFARGVDDNLVMHMIYQFPTDSDLYTRNSTNFGVTFSTATNIFTGTVVANDTALSKNQTAYQRGSDVVFPYIVNDNSTLKYNERVLRTITAPTSKTWVKQTGTWKLATTWVKDAGTWKKPTKSYVKKTGVWTEV